ncbi:hypothetical protein [Mycoplasma suis]|uniref:Uncharacterized protein n=1 Tax=Mycoplasma suis (strain Illinois) TaxID=768700 RepID=F0QQK5_MYCSL|nr:hypothetical protein [Mycoplasma suis]ADX97775.1 hypothetical protein MSU_0231 [Mycoplasma suis str. Illinois]
MRKMRKRKTKFLDSNNCSKRIKEKWEYSLSKQPEVWFKATEEDMEKALSIHFSNETWTVEVKKVGNDWEVGPMKCSKSSSSVEDLDKKYVEASCSHKDEDSKNPN